MPGLAGMPRARAGQLPRGTLAGVGRASAGAATAASEAKAGSRYGAAPIAPAPQSEVDLAVSGQDARVAPTENGAWMLTDEKDAKNPFEKTKLAKDALAYLVRENGLAEMAAKPFEELDGSSDEATADIDVRLKWLGLFHRRGASYGRFMLRLRLPNGVLTAAQCRYMDKVISRQGAEWGCADVTTRQNLQLRGTRGGAGGAREPAGARHHHAAERHGQRAQRRGLADRGH